MFDVYRLSTFLVHANNSHKHPARTLIIDASVARDETPPSARTTSMGEIEKREARQAARTRKSKGAQPEDRTQATSKNPPNIEVIPHKFSVGAWPMGATAGNTRAKFY
jgi:hypothetical protein